MFKLLFGKGILGRVTRSSMVLSLLATLLGCPIVAYSQSDPAIDLIRQLAEENFDSVNIGAGYAAMVDFAVSRDISSATFYPDPTEGVVDPTLKHSTLPFRHVFNPDAPGARPFLQGLFAYQKLASGFDTLPGESIESEWTTYGASLSGGFEIPLGENLIVLPVISVGYGRLENRASFYGPISESLLQPALSGEIFNWDSNSVTYGASIGMDYRRKLSRFEIEVLAGLTHNFIESVNAPSKFTDFQGQATVFDLEINTVHPTNWEIAGSPLAIVGLFGNTEFFGPQREALGFAGFFEAGLGLELDISTRGHKVKSLRIGAKAIIGPDVDG
ncbi:MAG: hypothetical protein MUP90_12345 [Gammaproteobacteria bacterium]|nr:hypothetical protein [Gammaproteobacteria bacterium]